MIINPHFFEGTQYYSCTFLGGHNETLTITQNGVSKNYVCNESGSTTDLIILEEKKDITIYGNDTGFTRVIRITGDGTYTSYPTNGMLFWRGRQGIAWEGISNPKTLAGSYNSSSNGTLYATTPEIISRTGGSSNYKKGLRSDPVDFTNYKYLHFVASTTTNGTNGLANIGYQLGSAASSGDWVDNVRFSDSTPTHYCFDISNLSGEHRAIAAVYVVASRGQRQVAVSHCWLSNSTSGNSE